MANVSQAGAAQPRKFKMESWDDLLHVLEIAAIIIGGFWVASTWTIQGRKERASLVPALEVRISAYKRELQSPGEFVPNQDVYLIEGVVTIKNVGTSKTTLQMCECVPTPGNQTPYTFTPCKRPKATPWEASKACPAGREAQGPIVVSKVKLDGNRMSFDPPNRFWLSRPPLDRSPEVVLTDEMRPNAKDEFEFLVTVPKKPGMYAITFASHLDDDELHRMEEAGYTMPPWRLRWYDTTFIEVP